MSTSEKKLVELMSGIKDKKIQLPSIQRNWCWNDEKILNVIASVISDYPIGSLLFLECGEGNSPFAYSPISGVTNTEKISPNNLILDGQQRLTAIFGAMYNSGQPVKVAKKKEPVSEKDYKKCFYYLDIKRVIDSKFDKIDAVISVPEDKKIKKSKKNIALDLSTQEKEFSNKMFPLNIIFNKNQTDTWKKSYFDHWKQNPSIKDDWMEFSEIINTVKNYQIPVTTLSETTEIDAVCKIFEQVNSSNQPLTGFDLLNAIYAKQSFDLSEDWKKRKGKFFSEGILENFNPKDFLRACKFFVNHKKNNPNFKKNIITDLEFDDYEKYSAIVSNGFKEAKELLKEEGITIKDNLPYSPQLISLSVICALLIEKNGSIIDGDSSVKQKIKKWYWCGVFSEYYGNGANDSKLFGDITNFMKWVNENETPEIVKDFEFDLARFKYITADGGAIFRGVFALLIKNGCADFASGRKIVDLYNDKNIQVETHHIFPKQSCKKKYGISVESIINKTPLSKKTNDRLGGIKPSNYLMNLTTGEESNTSQDAPVSDEDIEKYLRSHWIDKEDLDNDNFEDFICHRAKNFLKAICDVTGKKFEEPPDADIKKVFFGK